MTFAAGVAIVEAMPTYEYRCNACQREFDYQQKMSDPDLVTCEACGEDKLEKLISWTAFGSTNAGLYSKNPGEAVRSSVDKGRPPKKAPAPSPAPSPPAPSPSPSPETPARADADGATVADSDETPDKSTT